MAVDDKPCGCCVAQYCAKCWDESFGALQAMTADNARLCEIALAADKLAEAVSVYQARCLPQRGEHSREFHEARVRKLNAALQAYKAARQGQ